ncbi:MAG: hypothetical protein KIH63_004695 [Candidatus Saccharibacteria bacterium]|nr:hypothetical protein [Candidatus Saccharibacteria bacterium]
MSVKGIIFPTTGLADAKPSLLYINTDDTLATVTAASYLNKVIPVYGNVFSKYQMAMVQTTDQGAVLLQISVAVSTGVITLQAAAGSEAIVLPTVANHIVYATTTGGNLSTANGINIINGGGIYAGLSGTAGTLRSYSATASRGYFEITAVANTGNTALVLTNAAQAAARTITIPDGGQTASSILLTNNATTQTIATGSLALTLGNITAAAGNIAATLGSVAAGTTVTAGTGVTATTGNITATAGNLVAGSSGAAGTVSSFPSTAARGSLKLVAVANTGNTDVTISNAAHGQATVYTIADIGAATGGLAATTTPFVMKSVAGAAAAGGAAAQSFTDAFCTTGSNVVGNWATQTNAGQVVKIVPGNGSFVVTSTVDIGAGTFNYIITK